MPEREPDTSASTAEFRAFATASNGDNASPWSMRASGKRVLLLAVVIIVVAVALGIIAMLVISK
jgi:flagellar basal body-associated protein FliL